MYHMQKCLLQRIILSEYASDNRGYGFTAWLLYTAHGHTHMLRFDHHHDTLGMQMLFQGIGNLGGHILLNLRSSGKLARTVEVFARRPQIQENMTAQIADALEQHLHPKGVMVMIEAEHMCMTMRGVQKPGSKTVTTIVRGVFAEDYALQQTFLHMVHN